MTARNPQEDAGAMSQSSKQSESPEKIPAVAERRSAERRTFSAEAEILDQTSGARLAARVADISPDGCYLDTVNPFAVDTPVRVTICRHGAEFSASGHVRNAQGGMGMGIAFTDFDEGQRALLESWMREPEFPHSHGLSIAGEGPANEGGRAPERAENLAERLVSLLHKKGVLSDSDVAFLLRDQKA
jgi:PilZ domain